MEDSAEIVDRLDRIGALVGAGTNRSELLGEIRQLLEEGERRLYEAAEASGGRTAGGADRSRSGSGHRAPDGRRP
ncbi:MAG TPA: hypothetical protein VH306_05050 [Gaiellaceae bacterium]|jgi:hypothetical protein